MNQNINKYFNLILVCVVLNYISTTNADDQIKVSNQNFEIIKAIEEFNKLSPLPAPTQEDTGEDELLSAIHKKAKAAGNVFSALYPQHLDFAINNINPLYLENINQIFKEFGQYANNFLIIDHILIIGEDSNNLKSGYLPNYRINIFDLKNGSRLEKIETILPGLGSVTNILYYSNKTKHVYIYDDGNRSNYGEIISIDFSKYFDPHSSEKLSDLKLKTLKKMNVFFNEILVTLNNKENIHSREVNSSNDSFYYMLNHPYIYGHEVHDNPMWKKYDKVLQFENNDIPSDNGLMAFAYKNEIYIKKIDGKIVGKFPLLHLNKNLMKFSEKESFLPIKFHHNNDSFILLSEVEYQSSYPYPSNYFLLSSEDLTPVDNFNKKDHTLLNELNEIINEFKNELQSGRMCRYLF